jgi:glycine/D-amino acid oxidase-like deaminating enzyme
MFAGVEDFDFAVAEPAAAYSDAVDITNGFARGARDAGATVITGERVRGIEHDGEAVSAVQTTSGTVTCEEVVFAAGPWTPRLADEVDVTIPIIPTREEVFLLDPPESFLEEHWGDTPMMRFHNGEWYMRPDFNGGILVATHPFAEEPVDPDTYDDSPDQDTALTVYDLLADNVPELVDAEIKGQYCGLYSTTPDHDFILDQAGPAGCYFAAGFSGHGFKMAPAVGKIMRDLIVEGDPSLTEMDMFSIDRFDFDEEGHGQPVEPH